MVWSIWANWCKERTANETSPMQAQQKLMIYQPLLNWWLKELQKREAYFIEETIYIPDHRHARKLYAEFVIDLFEKFSKPLIKQAYG